jgi:1-phosphofructokinase
MTAGLAASLGRGELLPTALRVGAACGALNVVRSGLGTVARAAVEAPATRVELRGRGDGT